ncbi:MAG: malto-oligosyltrehalose trehalohydrolase [Planctomycetes bacterium]|nr:malto-oligosyltrehalose trehalohydrolase [Planctomycetota bacterium]
MKQFSSSADFQLGATKLGLGLYSFRVWAPFCSKVELKLFVSGGETLIAMEKDGEGYFHAEVSNISSGTRYLYVLDGKKESPDPASRFQPEGVHGPSCVVDHDDYKWKDGKWKGIALQNLIFYESHIGTFTPEGTFEAAIKKLPYLKKLGITCLEIMPVAQFPGKRNWGYDGVGIYAVQNSYGGPEAFKRLIDACHRAGIAVCLDVVYNHLGPEGNYLNDFGPYFTKKYHTPWGDAINYDDRESGHVRRFVIENALRWVLAYHIDVLRLDAVHGIYDFSAKHILQELNDAVQNLAQKLGRSVHVIAESDLNDSRLIRPKKQGGYGLSGQWNDDFHHSVHAYLTGERQGYYEDFGRLDDILKAIKEGFVYDGKYSPFRKRCHGNSVKDMAPQKLVICIQNHDQVGNRAFGERLSTLVDFNKQKLAAALLILSPNSPLLFMGQEYGEGAPFQYFVDHGDADLIRAVQEGRKKEFAAFGWKDIPDPESEKTFLDSKLNWNALRNDNHHHLWRLYKDVISLRRSIILNSRLSGIWYNDESQWIALEYTYKKQSRFGIIVSFFDREQNITAPFRMKTFNEIFNTAYSRYGGKIKQKIKKYHKREILVPGYGALAGEINSY